MEQRRWHPSSWSSQTVWQIHVWAGALSSVLVLTGVGLAVIAGVASARNKPNEAFLTRLEIVGWVLLVLGLVLGFVFVLTRNAEKPRPYRVRLIIPGIPTLKPIGPTTEVFGLVLDNVFLVNESDETVSLEFTLNCEVQLGMHPYRDYYRQNRTALVNDYLSNPRHLGPRDRAEAHLPFMSDDGTYPDAGRCTSLTVSVNPPDGDHFDVPLPTDGLGTLVEGLIKPLAVHTQEPQTLTDE